MDDTQKVRREGFAYALALDLWPNLRKKDAPAFDRDVQLLYEYMLQPPRHGGDPLHNLNLAASGHQQHAALVRAEHWITGTRDHPTALSEQLSTGNVQAAAHTLGFTYQRHALPVPFKGGYPEYGKMPSTWDVIKGVPGQVPNATKRVIGDVGSGAGKAGSAIGSGIGDFLSGHIMWIVIAVVLVLIIKK